MRRSVNRMNTGLRKGEGEKTFKVEGGVYENTTELEAVPNNRKFNKLKTGYIHKINRPAFKYNQQKIPNESVPYYKSNRTGTGNYAIKRGNFKAAPIRARHLDFAKMELQELRDAGEKVALGDQTLDRLFNVEIADSSDGEWLIEYKKRIDAGETAEQIAANPPFRREQRTITKQINFSTQGLQLNDKIELLRKAVMSNAVETTKEIGEVASSLAIILEKNINDLTLQQEKALGKIVDRLNIPADPLKAGLDERVYSAEEYSKQQGVINLYIYAKATRDGLDVNAPIMGVSGRNVKMSSLVTILSAGKGELFLDVQDMKVVNRSVAEFIRPGLKKTEERPADIVTPTVAQDFPAREDVQGADLTTEQVLTDSAFL